MEARLQSVEFAVNFFLFFFIFMEKIRGFCLNPPRPPPPLAGENGIAYGYHRYRVERP